MQSMKHLYRWSLALDSVLQVKIMIIELVLFELKHLQIDGGWMACIWGSHAEDVVTERHLACIVC